MSTSITTEYIQSFCVPIQKTVLELNIDSLTEFCYEMKRKNEKGVENKSNIGGWHSDNVFNETHTEFVKLKNKIEEAANLYHHESATRGYEDTPEKQQRFQGEVDYMLKRWGTLLPHDPAYNPNLTHCLEDFSMNHTRILDL